MLLSDRTLLKTISERLPAAVNTVLEVSTGSSRSTGIVWARVDALVKLLIAGGAHAPRKTGPQLRFAPSEDQERVIEGQGVSGAGLEV